MWASVREVVKYYFADFTDKIFAKKSYGFGGYRPPSPFTDIPKKNFLQKVLKMVFFGSKTPVFDPKNRLWIWGVPPLPL